MDVSWRGDDRPRYAKTGRVARGLRATVAALDRVLIDPWRRSLSARVVGGTLVLSVLVIAFVGWLVVNQVADRLFDAKVDSAQREAGASLRAAQEQVAAAEPSVSEGELVDRIAEDLWTRGRSTGLYEVVVDSGAVRQSPGLDPDAGNVPRRLETALSGDRLHGTFSEVTLADGTTVPAVALGAQLVNPMWDQPIDVYYLFPLTQEDDVLGMLQQALVVAGMILVVLLSAIAWFVTRQAVTPVRAARQIAERLASGLLDERMRVRGKDDLARLATSFNQMASSLQRQIRQLEEMSRIQRRFVSDVSHELRTPLTTVRMAADVLHEARGEFTPTIGRSAELLRAELDRFEGLLSDLLEISRYDAGAAVLERTAADVVALVRRVVEGVAPVVERKGSRIELVLPEGRVDAPIDSRRIERIVRNLVANAAEYGNEREIVVRVAADATTVAVSVRDFGVGLKPGEAAQVFDRFWRADPARTRTTGGSGLGLAISLEDAHLHDGWLQAWGSPGRGSHFRLTLPRDIHVPVDHSPLPLLPPEERSAMPAPTQAPPRTSRPISLDHAGADEPGGAGATSTTDADVDEPSVPAHPGDGGNR